MNKIEINHENPKKVLIKKKIDGIQPYKRYPAFYIKDKLYYVTYNSEEEYLNGDRFVVNPCEWHEDIPENQEIKMGHCELIKMGGKMIVKKGSDLCCLITSVNQGLMTKKSLCTSAYGWINNDDLINYLWLDPFIDDSKWNEF